MTNHKSFTTKFKQIKMRPLKIPNSQYDLARKCLKTNGVKYRVNCNYYGISVRIPNSKTATRPILMKIKKLAKRWDVKDFWTYYFWFPYEK